MATRNLAQQTITYDECTEFQLHKSQLTGLNGLRHKIFDYAEYRLISLARQSERSERRFFLEDLVERYRQGNVMVGWRYGEPVFITVTLDG